MIEKILEVFSDMGIMIFDDPSDDFALHSYIADSLVFIDFIVRIEKKLGVELTDDYLDNDILNSAKGFSAKLEEYVNCSLAAHALEQPDVIDLHKEGQ